MNGQPEVESVALKRVRTLVDPVQQLNPLLCHEACALVLLQGHPSIPRIFAYGKSQYYEYLAMELLGCDLRSYFTTLKQPLTLRNLASIAYQMLDVLECVHKKGIVHCDISIANMMFGQAQGHSSRIYLIDFGMCLPYRDYTTGQHLPDRQIPRIRGNPQYTSLNIHLHHWPSRRDDLESLAYVLIRLLRGEIGLPWRDLPETADIYKQKLAWSSV